MSFQIPQYLQNYLNSAKYRKPFENFTENSTFYSQLDYKYIHYMNNVVRPCIAYANACVDGIHNSSLSSSTGFALAKGATRLVMGDKVFFNGNDLSVKFLSDVWSPKTNFNNFLSRAIGFMIQGGTSVCKLNIDERGRVSLSAFRIDRSIITADETGEVVNAVFYIGLLTDEKADTAYWLVEERKYNEEYQPCVVYKVFARSGTAEASVLPNAEQKGINLANIPQRVLRELKKLRVNRLNEELPLPIQDGLGVWLMRRTATNSCIPDCPFGDPLLYGCLDMLWSIDVVLSGSLTDVLNGESKILVPKQFLQDTISRLQTQYKGVDFTVTTAEVAGYNDDTFVYVMPSSFDKDKMTPQPVQFDIRADAYGKMLEMYQRLSCAVAGFSPTSIFPYLTPDQSAKTATEVTAEENLTRAAVKDAHSLITPVLNRMLAEVLRLEGYNPDIQIQLSDYIGNKLLSDQNIRDNYNAGLMPKDIAVKKINNLTESETKEYIQKITQDNAINTSEFYE